MMRESDNPIISVCVANYNGEAIIADCIESILRQVNAPSFEIIVHDDASTDDSLDIIRGYDEIILISSGDNAGFCVSNNRMAAAARGEFLLLLNNDAQLFDDALATLWQESRNHAHKTLLGLPQYDASSGKLVDFGLELDYFGSSVPIRQAGGKDVAMVIGACMWVPASLWSRIGGFPEWFETNAEDVYLCCYARLLGYKIYVPGKSGFLHLIGHTLGGGKRESNTLRISARRRYFSERNRLFVQWLFYPVWLLPFTTIANIVVLSLEAIVLSIANRRFSLISDIYIKSQLDAFAHLDTVLRCRRIAMQSRAVSFSVFFAAFTFIPQKLRLLFSAGIPKS
jgi:GT2 family glycosyltransferase